MILALVIFGVATVLWLGFEVWRAPLCCNRCEMPVSVCRCVPPCSQDTESNDAE